mmetsp:Transcript_2746/g.8043  ORF Transcript_2746/g.8043 Transcript_2746/m.8043 type:complete len:309 (+) Transcript_2746:1345-2271(+)
MKGLLLVLVHLRVAEAFQPLRRHNLQLQQVRLARHVQRAVHHVLEGAQGAVVAVCLLLHDGSRRGVRVGVVYAHLVVEDGQQRLRQLCRTVEVRRGPRLVGLELVEDAADHDVALLQLVGFVALLFLQLHKPRVELRLQFARDLRGDEGLEALLRRRHDRRGRVHLRADVFKVQHRLGDDVAVFIAILAVAHRVFGRLGRFKGLQDAVVQDPVDVGRHRRLDCRLDGPDHAGLAAARNVAQLELAQVADLAQLPQHFGRPFHEREVGHARPVAVESVDLRRVHVHARPAVLSDLLRACVAYGILRVEL